MHELQQYIGKVKICIPEMYLVCGIDYARNRSIALPLHDINPYDQNYGSMLPSVNDNFYTLAEAHQILFDNMKYLIEWNKFLIIFDNSEMIQRENMKSVIRRLQGTLIQLQKLRFRSNVSQKQIKELQKGLYRIKKRTHHYFSDELFHFIVSNYMTGYQINFFGMKTFLNANQYYSNMLEWIEKIM